MHPMASQAQDSSTIVNVVEVTRVTPSAESTTESTLPLTFFDTFQFKSPPPSQVFFYSLPESESSRPFFDSVIVPKLKLSLSRALNYYLPLAGSLTWPPSDPKPISIYTANDGVSLTVAESAADFSHLCRKRIKYMSELQPLVPRLGSSDDRVEAFSLQITLFPEQGFAVGITLDHLVLDGQSAVSFFQAWAHICREGEGKELTPELLPSFDDRSLMKDPTGLDLLYLNQWTDGRPERRSITLRHEIVNSPPDQVLITFELSKQDIEKLKEKASTETQRSHPSTFVVVVAHTVMCLIRAKNDVSDRSINLILPADCRARLDPPVACNYFGNCVLPFFAEIGSAKDLTEEKGFGFAVERLSDAVIRLNSDPLVDMDKKVTTIQGFIKAVRAGKERLLYIRSSHRFGFFKVDFGWGRPKLVESVLDIDGKIGLSEGRNGNGGVEVQLAMKKHAMERFAQLFPVLKL